MGDYYQELIENAFDENCLGKEFCYWNIELDYFSNAC